MSLRRKRGASICSSIVLLCGSYWFVCRLRAIVSSFYSIFEIKVLPLQSQFNRIFRNMKLTKSSFLSGYIVVVLVLALVRLVFPGIAEPSGMSVGGAPADSLAAQAAADSVGDCQPLRRFLKPDGSPVKHRIYSVPSFRNTFPDNNDIQLEAAKRIGVPPVQNRKEAEKRMDELVYVGSNPYFHVDRLTSSIPYLVPKASVLLQDIGKAFFDSLYIKGIPLHKIIVTSVLRTKDDVAELRNRNLNATENSCHLYGTTFDICYNRYKTVEDPDGPERRAVRNDTLKWVLSEVLRDFREQGRCYIKYEVKQGCFHMTVND